MKTSSYIALAFMILFAAASCRKIEQLPAKPHIEFTSFAVFDTMDILGNEYKGGRLKFYFEDGDGDLGLDPENLQPPDTVDLFFDIYRKAGNVFHEVTDTLDPVYPSNYIIPYMKPLGRNPILKGTIAISFLYLNYSPASTDTVKYEFWIKDRALNVSDTAMTCEIFLSVNGLYQ